MTRWYKLLERLVIAVERISRLRGEIAEQHADELRTLRSELHAHLTAKRHSRKAEAA